MSVLNMDLSGVEVAGSTSGGGGWLTKPAGTYTFTVTQSSYKQTEKGGMCLHLILISTDRDLDGPGGAWELREYLNLENKSQTTVDIAKRMLRELAVAVGLSNPDYVQDSEDLHGVTVACYVTRKKGSGGYVDDAGFENRVSSFQKIEPQGAAPEGAVPETSPATKEEQPF